MIKVVFQGDSITDSGRARDNDFNKGFGYAGMASGVLGAEAPLEYEFYNRGIGGDRMHNILARNQRDVLWAVSTTFGTTLISRVALTRHITR